MVCAAMGETSLVPLGFATFTGRVLRDQRRRKRTSAYDASVMVGEAVGTSDGHRERLWPPPSGPHSQEKARKPRFPGESNREASRLGDVGS